MTQNERAATVYESLKETAAKHGLRTTCDGQDRAIALTLKSGDFQATVMYKIMTESERAAVYAALPFAINPEKIVDLILACTYINSKLSAGKFMIDTEDGSIVYESFANFASCENVNADFCEYVLFTPFAAIKKHIENLYALNKGLITIKHFSNNL